MILRSIDTKPDWWIKTKAKYTQEVTGDVDVLLGHIENIKQTNRTLSREGRGYSFTYEVDGAFHGQGWIQNVSHTKAEKMIINGHLNANMWINLYPRRFDFRSRLTLPYDPGIFSAWTLDLDSVNYSCTEELIEGFREKGLIVPREINQTDGNNFQSVFTGPYGYWTEERKLRYLCQFAGISRIPDSHSELRDMLTEAGIDHQYCLMNNIHHKFRLPGSVKNKLSGQYVCKGWENEGYNFKDPAKPHDKYYTPVTRVLELPKSKTKIETDRAIAVEIYEKSLEMILRALAVVPMKNKHRRVIADHIASNLTLFKRGCMAMHQETCAEAWGVTQMTAGRWLKALRELGILVRTRHHRFIPGNKLNRAAEYGLGPVLIDALSISRRSQAERTEKIMKSKPVQVLTTHYDEVSSNNAHILADIRAAKSMGMACSELLKVVAYKQEFAGIYDRMEPHHIKNAWNKWDTKMSSCYKIPPAPLIDSGPLIEVLSGEYEEEELEYRRA